MKKKTGFDRKTIIALITALVVLVGAWGVRYHICHRQVGEVMALLNKGRTWCWEEDILKDRSVDSKSACEAKDLEATVRRLMKEFGRREGASLAEIRVTGLPKPLYFQVGEKGHAYLFVPSIHQYGNPPEYEDDEYLRFYIHPKANIKLSEPKADYSYTIDIETNIPYFKSVNGYTNGPAERQVQVKRHFTCGRGWDGIECGA